MKFLIILSLLYLGCSHIGIDASSLISQSSFQCMKNSGMDFAVMRGYRSSGSVDPNACASLKNAQAAGLSTHTYIFPNTNGDPSQQIDAIISGLSGCGYSYIFIDVEQYDWKDQSFNRNFLKTMIDHLVSRTGRCDIYTNKVQWGGIVGLDYTYGSKCGLWWASWDNQPNFNDFSPFSGWNQAEMKQYTGDSQVCGSDIDHDYYA